MADASTSLTSPGKPDAAPRVVAHRGFAGVNPENTVAAARAAAEAGADAVELDVMPCADGVPVVFHDDHLDAGTGRSAARTGRSAARTDRTAAETGHGDAAEGESTVGGWSRGVTDGAGVVWETTCEAVLEAEVLDSGERVPRLDDFAAAVPDDVALNVELKRPGAPAVWTDRPRGDDSRGDDPGGDSRRAAVDAPRAGGAASDSGRAPWGPFVDAVLAALDGCGNDVLFSSFSHAALDAVRDRAPEAAVAVLFAADPGAGLAAARRIDAGAIHPSVDLVVDFDGARVSRLDPHGLVATAREEGRAVNVWTVDTWYEATRLREAGADGIIADYPGLLDGRRVA
ncbi:MAG: glycerophosphodiester phosphodiesterase [Salinigranum sp.]